MDSSRPTVPRTCGNCVNYRMDHRLDVGGWCIWSQAMNRFNPNTPYENGDHRVPTIRSMPADGCPGWKDAGD